MPIADAPGTRAPDEDPWLVSMLVDAWKKQDDEKEALQTHGRPVDAPYFASDAGKPCSRELYYALSGVEREPMDLPGLWKMGLGKGVHKTLEELPLPEGWFPEVRFDLGPIGIPGRGRADLAVTENEYNDAAFTRGERGWQFDGDPIKPHGVHTVVDYMTQNGFGYKIAVDRFKGGPEGPKLGKLIQTALAVIRMNAEQGVVAHFAMEVLGPDFAKGRIGSEDLRRFCAQWSITRSECEDLVDKEKVRVQRILAARDAKTLPVRTLRLPNVPSDAVVVDPAHSRWEVRRRKPGTNEVVVTQAGTTWCCSYCPYQGKCVEDGPGGAHEGETF